MPRWPLFVDQHGALLCAHARPHAVSSMMFSICMHRLYTEMDFRNEAANAQRMQLLLSESEHGRSASVFIPQPMLQHTTRCGTWPQRT